MLDLSGEVVPASALMRSMVADELHLVEHSMAITTFIRRAQFSKAESFHFYLRIKSDPFPSFCKVLALFYICAWCFAVRMGVSEERIICVVRAVVIIIIDGRTG